MNMPLHYGECQVNLQHLSPLTQYFKMCFNTRVRENGLFFVFFKKLNKRKLMVQNGVP